MKKCSTEIDQHLKIHILKSKTKHETGKLNTKKQTINRLHITKKK